MKCSKKLDWIDIGIFAVFTVFFGYLFITGEPQYLGDTFQHENQFVTREPVYALFFQLLRSISPQHHYQIMILLQNLLAIVANTIFVCFLRRYFSMHVFCIPVVVLIVLAPHIMTPLASATNMILTNSLLSEGISFSLYLFFVIYILKAMTSEEILSKYTFLALGWAVLLSLVRGQMMTLLIVWFLVIGVKAVLNHKGKKLIWLTIMLAVSFVGRGMLVKTYNYLEQGIFVNTVSGQAMSVANVIYVSDCEDGEAIQDEELRALFYEIFDAAYADGMNYRFSGDGLIARAQHHEECHDALNFDYFAVSAKVYISETKGIYVTDYQRMMVEVDKVASALMKELLPQVMEEYVYNYIAMITMGFIRSVAYVHPILNWYALLIYLCAVVLMILLWKKNKKSKTAPFMAVVLLMIVGNVTATSLMLQCISRYMIYNLPLFYIAGLTMLMEYMQVSTRNK